MRFAGAESDTVRLRARLIAKELTKEVAARGLEGLRVRVLDAAVLLGQDLTKAPVPTH